MTAENELQQRWQKVMMMGAVQSPSLALVKGEGCTVWDAHGRQYIDLMAGVAVNALGHGHPAIIDAVTRQMKTIGHVSNLYASEPAVALAEKLTQLLASNGTGRVFFTNSGAESNEAAFKIARRTGRKKIVSAMWSFHGRTMAALALTGQPDKQAGFEPLPGPVEHVPYGDVDALQAMVDGDTAAVFLEVVQGEGGVIPAPAGYLEAARSICDSAGALLVFDEVQTGIGRTGEWFAHQRANVRPDVITLAKGLGGGFPLGACVAFNDTAELLGKGQHASTFGGNPVAAAAANAVIDTIAKDDLLTNVQAQGKALMAGIESIEHPLIDHVRGLGLMLGIVLTTDNAVAIERIAQQQGFLVNPVRPDVVRLVPPLIINEGEVAQFVDQLPAILDEAQKAVTT